MQALVALALAQVGEKVGAIDYASTATDKAQKIAKAINSVDALKSAIKAL